MEPAELELEEAQSQWGGWLVSVYPGLTGTFLI